MTNTDHPTVHEMSQEQARMAIHGFTQLEDKTNWGDTDYVYLVIHHAQTDTFGVGRVAQNDDNKLLKAMATDGSWLGLFQTSGWDANIKRWKPIKAKTVWYAVEHKNGVAHFKAENVASAVARIKDRGYENWSLYTTKPSHHNLSGLPCASTDQRVASSSTHT